MKVLLIVGSTFHLGKGLFVFWIIGEYLPQ